MEYKLMSILIMQFEMSSDTKPKLINSVCIQLKQSMFNVIQVI